MNTELTLNCVLYHVYDNHYSHYNPEELPNTLYKKICQYDFIKLKNNPQFLNKLCKQVYHYFYQPECDFDDSIELNLVIENKELYIDCLLYYILISKYADNLISIHDLLAEKICEDKHVEQATRHYTNYWRVLCKDVYNNF